LRVDHRSIGKCVVRIRVTCSATTEVKNCFTVSAKNSR